MRLRLTISMALALGVSAIGGMAVAQEISAGRIIAQRYCAACHDVADGESPHPDAPPFARLQERYGGGGLAELLEKGMIKDRPYPLEESMRRVHPSMPAFPLSEAEVVALAKHLRTFEAGPSARSDP
jgi:cytochrome c